MNFNVYLDETTVERLNRLARSRKTTRNALIREAVAHLLERQATSGWPTLVLEHEGVAGARAFEATRGKLRPPKRNPLR